jgi:hypothetical protein
MYIFFWVDIGNNAMQATSSLLLETLSSLARSYLVICLISPVRELSWSHAVIPCCESLAIFSFSL